MKRENWIAAVFILIIGGFFLLNRIIVPPEISQSERRPLQTMPKLSVATLVSGAFMAGFEDYAADSFAWRDSLRTLRAAAVFGIFRQTDKSGLYCGAGGAGRLEKLDARSAARAAEKISLLAEGLDGLNLYYSFVPDKSVYAGRPLPGFDAEEARRVLAGVLAERLTYVDLVSALTAEDYYRTDLHWDQARLGGVLAALGAGMGFAPATDFEPEILGDFTGVYAGQLALPLKPDRMTVMTSDTLNEAEALYLGQDGLFSAGVLYDRAAFAGRDPYDVFLRGAQSVIVLENASPRTDKELYLFRDSFGSSLAPLLLPSYARVTLIDLRYVDSRVLRRYVTFRPGADVLFLYSAQILNNETVLLAQ
ncbi:MAG: hypothetical protein LBQ16_06475 [Gracilibacteraceae bacterium]|jgi:hypothetical protein|nr:hypothetical protein [Gracilibacteraceae bacterium]